ncbi:MAG: hypothetical protein ACAI44_30000 [Candidatus Sericytochromatia bacterium]
MDTGSIEVDGQLLEVEFQENKAQAQRAFDGLTENGKSLGDTQHTERIKELVKDGVLYPQFIREQLLNAAVAPEVKKVLAEALAARLPDKGALDTVAALLTRDQPSADIKHALIAGLKEIDPAKLPASSAEALQTALGKTLTDTGLKPEDLDAAVSLLLRSGNKAEAAKALAVNFSVLPAASQQKVLNFLTQRSDFDTKAIQTNLGLLLSNLKTPPPNPGPLFKLVSEYLEAPISGNQALKTALLGALGKETPLKAEAEKLLAKLSLKPAELERLPLAKLSPQTLSGIFKNLDREALKALPQEQREEIFLPLLDSQQGPELRRAVLDLFSLSRPDLPETNRLPFLLKGLEDPDQKISVLAADSLGSLRTPPAEILPALISKLSSQNLKDDARHAVLTALNAQLGLNHGNKTLSRDQKQELQQALLGLFKSNPKPEVRLEVLRTLSQLSPAPDPEISAFLLNELKSPDKQLAAAALDLLETYGDASTVAPLLEQGEKLLGKGEKSYLDISALRTALRGILKRDERAIAAGISALKDKAGSEIFASFAQSLPVPEVDLKKIESIRQALSSKNITALEVQFRGLTNGELRQVFLALGPEIAQSGSQELKALGDLIWLQPEEIDAVPLEQIEAGLKSARDQGLIRAILSDPATEAVLARRLVNEAARLDDNDPRHQDLLQALPSIDRVNLDLFVLRGNLIPSGRDLTRLSEFEQKTLVDALNQSLKLAGLAGSVQDFSPDQLEAGIKSLEKALGLPETGEASLENLRLIDAEQRKLAIINGNVRAFVNEEILPASNEDLDRRLQNPSFRERVVDILTAQKLAVNDANLRQVANELRLNDALGPENGRLSAETAVNNLNTLRGFYAKDHSAYTSDKKQKGYTENPAKTPSLDNYQETLQARQEFLNRTREAYGVRDVFQLRDLEAIKGLAKNGAISHRDLEKIAQSPPGRYSIIQREAARKLVDNPRLFDYAFSVEVKYDKETHRLDGPLHPPEGKQDQAELSARQLDAFEKILVNENVPLKDKGGAVIHGVVISRFYDNRQLATEIFRDTKVDGAGNTLSHLLKNFHIEGAGTNEDGVKLTLKAASIAPGSLASLKRDYEKLYGQDLNSNLIDEFSAGELGEVLALADTDSSTEIAENQIKNATRAEEFLPKLRSEIANIGAGNSLLASVSGHNAANLERQGRLGKQLKGAEEALKDYHSALGEYNKTRKPPPGEIITPVTPQRRLNEEEQNFVQRLEALESKIADTPEGPQRKNLQAQKQLLEKQISPEQRKELLAIKKLADLESGFTKATARVIIGLEADRQSDVYYEQAKAEGIAAGKNIAIVGATLLTVASFGTAAPVSAIIYGTIAGTAVAAGASVVDQATDNYSKLSKYEQEAKSLVTRQAELEKLAADRIRKGFIPGQDEESQLNQLKLDALKAAAQIKETAANTHYVDLEKVAVDSFEGFKTALITSVTTVATAGLSQAGGPLAKALSKVSSNQFATKVVINGLSGATGQIASQLAVGLELDFTTPGELQEAIKQQLHNNHELIGSLKQDAASLSAEINAFETKHGLKPVPDSSQAGFRRVATQPLQANDPQLRLYLQKKVALQQIHNHLEELQKNTGVLDQQLASAVKLKDPKIPLDYKTEKVKSLKAIATGALISFAAGGLLNSLPGQDKFLPRVLINATSSGIEVIANNAAENALEGKHKDVFEGIFQSVLSSLAISEIGHQSNSYFHGKLEVRLKAQGLKYTAEGRVFETLHKDVQNRLKSEFGFKETDPGTHLEAFDKFIKALATEPGNSSSKTLKESLETAQTTQRKQIHQEFEKAIKDIITEKQPAADADYTLKQYKVARIKSAQIGETIAKLKTEPETPAILEAIEKLSAQKQQFDGVAEKIQNGQKAFKAGEPLFSEPAAAPVAPRPAAGTVEIPVQGTPGLKFSPDPAGFPRTEVTLANGKTGRIVSYDPVSQRIVLEHKTLSNHEITVNNSQTPPKLGLAGFDIADFSQLKPGSKLKNAAGENFVVERVQGEDRVILNKLETTEVTPKTLEGLLRTNPQAVKTVSDPRPSINNRVQGFSAQVGDILLSPGSSAELEITEINPSTRKIKLLDKDTGHSFEVSGPEFAQLRNKRTPPGSLDRFLPVPGSNEPPALRLIKQAETDPVSARVLSYDPATDRAKVEYTRTGIVEKTAGNLTDLQNRPLDVNHLKTGDVILSNGNPVVIEGITDSKLLLSSTSVVETPGSRLLDQISPLGTPIERIPTRPSQAELRQLLPFGEDQQVKVQLKDFQIKDRNNNTIISDHDLHAFTIQGYDQASGQLSLQRINVQTLKESELAGKFTNLPADLQPGQILTGTNGLKYRIELVDTAAPAPGSGGKKLVLSRTENITVPVERVLNLQKQGQVKVLEQGNPFHQTENIVTGIERHLNGQASLRPAGNLIERVGNRITVENPNPPQSQKILPGASATYALEIPNGNQRLFKQGKPTEAVDLSNLKRGEYLQTAGQPPAVVQVTDIDLPNKRIGLRTATGTDHATLVPKPTPVHAYTAQVDLGNGLTHPIEVIVPVRVDGSHDPVKLNQALEAIKDLPFDQIKTLKQVRLNPSDNFDGKARLPGTFATAGQLGEIDLFPVSLQKTHAVGQNKLKGIQSHEFGHLLVRELFRTLAVNEAFPDQLYLKAQKADGISVTDYANTNIKEDIAEAIRVYLQTEGGTRPIPEGASFDTLVSDPQIAAKFKNRFKVIDSLFKNPVLKAQFEATLQAFVKNTAALTGGKLFEVPNSNGRAFYLPYNVRNPKDKKSEKEPVKAP